MALKRCKQCGMLKEETCFRPYTHSRGKSEPSRYRICRDCESINTTYRRAREQLDKGGLSLAESSQLSETVSKILQLYRALEAKGLQVPEYGVKKKKSAAETAVDKLLAFYGQQPQEQARQSTVDIPTEIDIPDDLNIWLTQDVNEWIENGLSPEYLQETVYESLKAKYRPQLGYDSERGLPIYDDTFKDVLNQILRRFDDYEDSMEEDVDG